MSEIKQVIVMRNDLGMRKGKVGAQAAHASMMFISDRLRLHGFYEADSHKAPGHNWSHESMAFFSEAEKEWLEGIFAKVVVRVDSEEELDAIYKAAKDEGLVAKLCTDSGLTEFHGVPTKTCVAIGPDYSEKIDKITGHLRLL